VLKLLRVDNDAGRAVTEEEITASLAEEGRDAGVIEHHEHQMVQNVFHLDDRPLTSLMVPRSGHPMGRRACQSRSAGWSCWSSSATRARAWCSWWTSTASSRA
jgi:hypothetical protein